VCEARSALLVFGPRRLPEIGRSLGKGMREFKGSITVFREGAENAVKDAIDVAEKLQPTLEM
jgi:sec-independent protein translocase protein TatA